ncbi:hypothetical protein GN244_ATG01154 [Phytophthora infestans]|uniref:Uncharacterized protein n=1 Tax=Phytophthora infestans TaxID=4787 RepID=A0A833TM44_PHYIN|nr:hypothetical protein GN244_ATG01154 [Phytophthora infestans]KAF4133473.1 hypothetical protein GN958_ATG17325 [Phytophthora infestans]
MVGGRTDVGEAMGLFTGVPGGPVKVARRRRRRREPIDMEELEDNIPGGCGDVILNGRGSEVYC